MYKTFISIIIVLLFYNLAFATENNKELKEFIRNADNIYYKVKTKHTDISNPAKDTSIYTVYFCKEHLWNSKQDCYYTNLKSYNSSKEISAKLFFNEKFQFSKLEFTKNTNSDIVTMYNVSKSIYHIQGINNNEDNTFVYEAQDYLVPKSSVSDNDINIDNNISKYSRIDSFHILRLYLHGAKNITLALRLSSPKTTNNDLRAKYTTAYLLYDNTKLFNHDIDSISFYKLKKTLATIIVLPVAIVGATVKTLYVASQFYI